MPDSKKTEEGKEKMLEKDNQQIAKRIRLKEAVKEELLKEIERLVKQ